MNHLFSSILGGTAAAVLVLASVPTHAGIYVADGFDAAVYTVGNDGMGKLHAKGTGETGFLSSAPWNAGDSSVVRCFSTGLAFPASWDGFTPAGAGSIGYKNTSTSGNGTVGSNDSNYRAGQRVLASGALPTEGTFYLRALMFQGNGAGTATRVEGMLRGIGFRTVPLVNLSSGSPAHGRTESGNALTNGVWFAFRKTSTSSSDVDTEIVFRFGGESQTLVAAADFAENTTYLCVAEVTLAADGATGRAFAMPVDDYDNAPETHFGSEVTTAQLSSTTPLAYLCMTAPYMTANANVLFDEIAAASDLANLVPVTVSDFSVYPTLSSLVPLLDGFSVPVTVDLGAGETANVAVEYGTDAESLNGSTNILSGVSAGTQTATVAGLAPDTLYYWRLHATANGHDDAVSSVQTVRTLGAPVLGTTSATLDGSAVVFTASLATPALDGDPDRPDTELLVSYSVGGTTQTRSLGSLHQAGTLSLSVQDLDWGATCTYTFTATATKDGRTFSATSAAATIQVVTSGDIYVSTSGSATAPYDTLAKAANNVASAIAIAGSGATVHLAPGEYTTTERVVLDRAIRVEGMTGNPADVIVRNVGIAGACRVFNLTHAGAVLSGVTVADGHIVGYTGGNLWITAGLVTNCVIQNASLSWTTADANSEHGGAGAYMRGGTMVSCILRGNSVSGTAVKDQATGILAKGSAVILNCLFDANGTTLESAVVHLAENAHMVGCTIVNSVLGAGTALNGGSASIRIAGESAYVQNCAVAGIVDTEGIVLSPLPASRFVNIANSAFDFNFDESLITSKNWVRGTTSTMFASYARGKYKPAAGSPLVDAGKGDVVNALPVFDLAGKPRLFRNAYDIGCYEWQGIEPTVIVFR